MAIRMADVRALCTKSELELVLQSTTKAIVELTSSQLRSGARRARMLRDKYATLASRQRREARGKQTARGKRPSLSNENTVRKQEIFAGVLEKFESRLERSERRAAATKTEVSKKGKVGKVTKTAKTTKVSKTAKTAKVSKVGKKKVSSAKPLPAARSTTAKLVAGKAGAGSGPIHTQEQDAHARASGLAVDTEGTAIARDLMLKSKSRSSQSSRALSTQERANYPTIQGHISSQGRRNQARRDSN